MQDGESCTFDCTRNESPSRRTYLGVAMDQSIGITCSCGVVSVKFVEGVEMTFFELGARSLHIQQDVTTDVKAFF